MRGARRCTLALMPILLSGAPAAAQVTILHSFAGGPTDGLGPSGSMILSGSSLFGMTQGGGSGNGGTIFRTETNGSGYGLLHSFAGGPNDGSNPAGSLLQSGPTLFGMTQF